MFSPRPEMQARPEVNNPGTKAFMLARNALEIATSENNRGTSLSGEVVMDCRRNLRACRALLAAWLAVPAVVQVAGGVS
jgi:hypothetical protein